MLPVLARATRMLTTTGLLKETLFKVTPQKRDAASGSARSRKSSTSSRTRSPTHARKGLEFVSLVLTQLQHWRGQIIAAHARAPRCAYRHVQGMSEAPRELRDSVSVTQRVAEISKVDFF
jgi:hypothetical protein